MSKHFYTVKIILSFIEKDEVYIKTDPENLKHIVIGFEIKNGLVRYLCRFGNKVTKRYSYELDFYSNLEEEKNRIQNDFFQQPKIKKYFIHLKKCLIFYLKIISQKILNLLLKLMINFYLKSKKY